MGVVMTVAKRRSGNNDAGGDDILFHLVFSFAYVETGVCVMGPDGMKLSRKLDEYTYTRSE